MSRKSIDSKRSRSTLGRASREAESPRVDTDKGRKATVTCCQ